MASVASGARRATSSRPNRIPGPVSRFAGCTMTFSTGRLRSCGRATGRWSRLTMTSVREGGKIRLVRATVSSRSERSPVIRQYCLGMGAPAITRVSSRRRTPSPPARTKAQAAPCRWVGSVCGTLGTSRDTLVHLGDDAWASNVPPGGFLLTFLDNAGSSTRPRCRSAAPCPASPQLPCRPGTGAGEAISRARRRAFGTRADLSAA